MSDRSFIRFGGLAGILLAVTSWLAVAEYYLFVPPAQRAPLGGERDAEAFLGSLKTDPNGLLTFDALYALIAFWALVATVALYFAVRRSGEAWSFFAVLVGTFASAGTVVSSLFDLAWTRFLAQSAAISTGRAATLLGVTSMNYAYREPSPANPVGVVTFGLTAVWFLVTAALLWRGGFPRLLAVLGVVAFADLAAGFLASVIGAGPVATLAAIVAGAVGGPLFWLWLGILLRRRPHAV